MKIRQSISDFVVKISKGYKGACASFRELPGKFMARFEDHGGDSMARNLVQKAAEGEKKPEVAPVESEQPVRVIMAEQLTQNKLDYLIALVHEGFRQCGVKFDEAVPKDEQKDAKKE